MSQRKLRDEAEKNIWKKDQADKRQRKIRDLQFELAMSKKAELIAHQQKTVHATEQKLGIEHFEKSLKRSGIGGDDASSAPLETSYEDPEAFLKRLEAIASKDWPTDSEIRDFQLHLRKRTKEAKQARMEKIRRRRRMQVDQAASAESLGDLDQSTLNDSSSLQQSSTKGDGKRRSGAFGVDDDEEDSEGEEDFTQEMLRSVDEKNDLAVAKAALLAEAEDRIRQFAEQFRMVSVESGEREAKLEEVMQWRLAMVRTASYYINHACYLTWLVF